MTFIPDPSEPLVRFECNSKDVSEGGIRVTTQREPNAGSDVLLVFELTKEGEKLSIPAIIVWAHPLRGQSGFYESGIKFATLSVHERGLLLAYISEHADREV